MTPGRTWWGKTWLRALEQLGLRYPDSRLATARTLARNGEVDLVHTDPGEISGWVDAPGKSFGVSIRLPVYRVAHWQRFDTVVAARLGNLAELRDDRLPTGIDRQLAPHDLTLFPAEGELTTDCPCPHPGPLCVHVMAVHHAWAGLFDDDPFLLTLLRGRDRDAVLAGLREARPVRRAGGPAALEPVPLARFSAADFFTARGELT